MRVKRFSIILSMGKINKKVQVKDRQSKTNRNIGPLFNLSDLDVLIGGIDVNRQLPSQITATIQYLSDDLTWCFGRPIPSLRWTDLFKVLTLSAWIGEFFIILTNAIVLYYFLRLDNYLRDILRYILMSFFLQLGAPNHYNPQSSIVRLVYGTNLVVGFMWNSIFSALWIGTMSKMYSEVQYQAIDEAISHDFSLVGAGDDLQWDDVRIT